MSQLLSTQFECTPCNKQFGASNCPTPHQHICNANNRYVRIRIEILLLRARYHFALNFISQNSAMQHLMSLLMKRASAHLCAFYDRHFLLLLLLLLQLLLLLVCCNLVGEFCRKCCAHSNSALFVAGCWQRSRKCHFISYNVASSAAARALRGIIHKTGRTYAYKFICFTHLPFRQCCNTASWWCHIGTHLHCCERALDCLLQHFR